MDKARLLIIRLTERCNLACRYCYAASCDVKTGDVSLAAVTEAVEHMAYGCEKLNIQLTGGEPLLCADTIEKMYAYIQRRGIRAGFSIQTNGILLDREHRKLLRAMHCAIGVSLDGMADANALRVYGDGRNSFDDACTGIRALSMDGMKCNLNAVVTSANAEKLDGLIGLAAYLGNIGGVGLDMFRALGRGRDNDFAPDAETLKAGLEKMLKKREMLSSLGVSLAIKELSKVVAILKGAECSDCYCYAQTNRSVAMDYKGDLYPCSSFVGLHEYCMGNIADGAVQLLPRRIPPLPEGCKQCEVLRICRGGCIAGRAVSGEVNSLDCLMHRTFIEYGMRTV